MDFGTLLVRLALKELELEALGVAPHHAEAATRYAFRRAAGIGQKAPEELQEHAFLSTLEENIEAEGRWVEGNLRAVREGEMARGINHARADDTQRRGYRRLGIEPGQAAKDWIEHHAPAATKAYDSFWQT